MKSKLCLLSKILTIIFTLLFALFITANSILMENTSAVSNFLGAKTQVVLKGDTEDEDTLYYKSQFNSLKEVIKNSEDVGEKVLAEGAVLLKNNDALPVAKNSKISLFSASSIDLAVGGGGSSATNAKSLNLKETFEADSIGLDINDNLWNWYTQNKATYGRSKGTSIGVAYSVNDASWEDLPDAKTENADVAVFVLSRLGSENVDIRVNQTGFTNDAQGDDTDLTNGNYLELTTKEKSVLRGLKQEKDKGTFGKIVILLNTANQVEGTFLDDEEYGVDGAIWCGSLGSTSAKALAEIFVGQVNPSGRLADTFWTQHRFNPVLANFGVYNYSGKTSSGGNPSDLRFYSETGIPYVVYQEGIYNGYRYTETRYEDKVLGRENTGDFDYSNVVAYPFGYGLSYSNFSYSNFQTTYSSEEDCYNVSVDVKNNGEYSGKETVQIYLQKPYTDYDIQNNIEKASVELVGFGKTKVLNKDETQTVTVKVDKKYFASYDAYGAKTYILDSGNYYLTAAKDSHDAINNILSFKSNAGENIDLEKICHYENADIGNKDLVYKENLQFSNNGIDNESYSTTDAPVQSGLKTEKTTITNQFDDVDINLYSGKGENSVQYMTRNNWNGTVFYGLDENSQFLNNNVQLSWNNQLEYDSLESSCKTVPEDTVAYPTYGSKDTNYSLIDMRMDDKGDEDSDNDELRKYDDPLWDKLLDQMSWEDYVTLLSCGERMTMAISSISKPSTIDHNGAVGVNQKYGANSGSNRGYALTTNDPDRGSYPPAYPCNAIVACTFNKELMKEYGNAWGEDALWAGYAGLYGPGINLHRGAYAGRTFEYYSEDPILSGEICAPITQGIQSKGVYVYLKHCFLNEQESKRGCISTWANEQALRELYLRAFQIPIEEGGAKNVMLGLNKIGTQFTGIQGFCKNVLRNEFGMSGFVVTDFMGDLNRVRMPLGHLQGMDLPDRNFSSYTDIYAAYKTKHGEVAWAMRESAHRILYTVVHSSTMNGISSSTRIITITPTWILAFNFGTVLSAIFFGLSWLLLISIYAFPYVNEKFKLIQTTILQGKDSAKELKVKTQTETQTALKEKNINLKTYYFSKKEGISAWIVRGVVIVCGVSLIITNSVGIGTTIQKNNQLISLEAAQVSNEIPNETLGGEGIKDHVFEVEDALFEGITVGGENGTISLTRNVVIGEQFSGGICLSNTRTCTNTPNTFTFKFNSDKAAKVIMEVSINCPSNWIGVQTSFDSVYKLKVNGKDTKSYTMTPAMGDCVNKFYNNTSYFMGVSQVPITIKEGENEIVLKATPEDNRSIDYINIKTSANLTEFTPSNSWDFSTYATIIKYPTANAKGKIKFYDNYAGGKEYDIPELGKGVEIGLYRYVNDEDSISYYLKNSDFIIKQVLKTTQKLTVDSKYAWFAPEEDGNIIYTQKEIIATSPLPKIMVKVPIGYRFVGWCDKNDASSFWTTDNFTMPDYDLSIEPCFETAKYTTENVGDTLGKVQLIPDKSDVTTPIRNDKISVGQFGKQTTDGTCNINVLNSSMLVNDLYEQATCYNYIEKINSGWSFLTMNALSLNGSNKTLLVYLQNQGEETISFDYWLTNSSVSPKNPSNPHESVVLKPGESTRLCLYLSFSNGNIMSYYQFTQDISFGLNLVVNEYIANGKLTQYEPQKYNVTLVGDNQFAAGGKQVALKEGTPIPAIDLGGQASTKEVYGYIVNDGITKTIVKANDYVVPQKDINITPIIVDKETQLSGFIVNNGLTEKYYSLESFKVNEQYVSLTPVCYADKMVANSKGQVNWNDSSIQVTWTPSVERIVMTENIIQDNKVQTQFTVKGKQGDQFRIMTPLKLKSISRNVSYTITNNGTEKISFTVYQVNSGNMIAGTPNKTIVLNAGESIDFNFNISYGNENLMTFFVLNEAINNGSFLIYTTIK